MVAELPIVMTGARLSLLAAAALVGAPGCFYGETINQRPSISIVPESDEPVYRGSPVALDSVYDDPDDSTYHGAFQWRVYACTDATTPDGCDTDPFYSSVLSTANFVTPVLRADGATPVTALRVVLHAEDALGATSKPDQLLLIPVNDAPPVVGKRAVSNYGFVVGAPIELYASVSDPDDGASALGPLDWVVFSPATQPSYTLTDLGVITQPDPTMIQTGKELTPQGTGMWSVQITATDPLGAMTTAELDMTVVDDEPPCIATVSPLAPPDGSSYPMTDPTLFQVPVVTDDLDVYPPQPNDPIKGVTTFSWSILPPGASTRVPLDGVTGNSVPLDPSTYSPGDIIELRVEIYDRNHATINCADDMSTCAINASQPTCYQRLTWRIEAL